MNAKPTGADSHRRVQAAAAQSSTTADLADAALDAAGIGIWEYDVATGAVSWSRSTFRIFGVEDIGEPQTYASFLARVHPDDRDVAVRHVTGALERESPAYVSTFRIVRPDGVTRTITCRGSAVVDDQQTTIGLLGAIVDVTDPP